MTIWVRIPLDIVELVMTPRRSSTWRYPMRMPKSITTVNSAVEYLKDRFE